MSVPTPILGTFRHNIDSKNRIFIPAKHRDALGTTFVIYPNIRNKYSLIVSSLEEWEAYVSKIRESDKLSGKDKAAIIKYLTKNGDTLTPDGQGRVVLSSALIELVKLEGPTVIVGCDDHAEIMSVESYELEEAATDFDSLSSKFEDADL